MNEESIGVKQKIVSWIYKVLLVIGIAFVLHFVWFVLNVAFTIDFSQRFREIPGVENIVFVDGWENQNYQRSFWGLKKVDHVVSFEECVGHEPVYSPDGRYILYSEIDYDYYESGMTDDEYCYYRVYDTETGEIVTIYQGYREWYNFAWK